MITKIKILAAIIIGLTITFFIYAAAELTKLRDSDILDVSFDEEDF